MAALSRAKIKEGKALLVKLKESMARCKPQPQTARYDETYYKAMDLMDNSEAG